MIIPAPRPFSGAALLGWSALNFVPALLAYSFIHNTMAVIYFPLIPLVSAATWLVTLPFGMMTNRFKEWVAGGPLGIVFSVLLCASLIAGI